MAPIVRSRVKDQALESWRDEGPMRQFRRRSGLSFRNIAAYLDVSTLTVQLWEAGTTTPLPQNLRKLRVLLQDENVEGRWREWQMDRPHYRSLFLPV